MSELSDLQAQLVALRKKRASGLQSVDHGDTHVGYKPDKDMAAAEASLVARINALTGTTPRGPSYIHQSGKGL